MNKTKERIINLHIEKLPEGEYLATSTDIPGLVAQGMTIAETVSIAKEVAKEIYLSCLEHGDPLFPAFEEPAAAFDTYLPIAV